MLSRRYYHTPLMMPRCVARLIGSSRREGLHDVIVLNQRPMHRVLASSIDYDHTCWVHWFFDMGPVARRPVHPPQLGLLRVMPTVWKWTGMVAEDGGKVKGGGVRQ